MRDIHRSTTTWLARRTERGSAARPLHRSHRRRLTLEPLEDRALLSLTTWTVNSPGDTGTGSGTSGDLRYCITQADQTPGDNTINFSVTGTITLYSPLPDLSNTTGLMDIEGPGAASLTVARSSASGTDFGVFIVDTGVMASVTGLTISGGLSGNGGGIENAGTLTLTNSTIADNLGGYGGGGIDNTGTLKVSNSTIADNSTFGSLGGGVDNEGTLTVTNSTISSNSAYHGGCGGIYNAGAATVINSAIDNNSTGGAGGGGGGGIYNAGTLTLTNSTIDNNSAFDGGGIYNTGTLTLNNSGVGGNSANGILNNGGTLSITNCTIDDNSAGDFGVPTDAGSGILNLFGAVTVSNSTIDNNSSGAGGGILNLGTMTVTNSTIDNNSAHVTRVLATGGGITNLGTLTVTDSTIDNNSVNNGSYPGPGGGGIYGGGTVTVTNSSINDNDSSGEGGGIYAGTATVTNSTIAGNSAGAGGGIYVAGTATVTNSTIADNSAEFGGGIYGGATLINCTISGNSASGFEFFGPIAAGGGIYGGGTLNNTIVALNTQGTGSGAMADDIVGTVSGAYNLIGTGGSGGLVNGTNGNQVGVADPGLGPLAYYGGPTQTIDLLPGSPAIDKGSNALAVDPSTGQPLTTDQRGAGFLRIVNGTVDIGAYEYLPAASDTVAVTWGTQTAPLQTAADGLRLLPQGRTTDLPWLGIDSLQVTLSQAQTLTPADVTVNSANGVNYGPVTVSGSGTSYTITLAQPINAADRVTITIVNPGVSMFNRRLDVLPGDVNDDGVVNVQDLVAIRNQMLGFLGAVPTIFGDILGDGTVDINDYTAVRELIGTTLP